MESNGNQYNPSATVEVKSEDGDDIRSVDQWLKYAPPAKGKGQWVDGRSAKELAKAWFQDGEARMPHALIQLLDSRLCTSEFRPDYAIPEFETRLDVFGRGRAHDLILFGDAKLGKTLVTIEAKVDEPFSEIIKEYVDAAIRKTPTSKIPKRVVYLSEGLFGHRDTGDLRYQLLHAVAGTLVEANNMGAKQCIFIVHEWVPSSGASVEAERNRADLGKFSTRLLGTDLKTDQLYGPIYVPGNQKEGHSKIPSDIPLYMGKIKTIMK